MKLLAILMLATTFCLLTNKEILAKNIIVNNTSNVTTVNDSSSTVNTGINLGGNTNYSGIKGNGIVKTFERKLDSFDKISTSIPFDIKVICSSENRAEITIDSNLGEYIETKIANNNLEIDTTKSFNTQSQVKIVIYTKNLNSMNISSSGYISASNINSKDFSLIVTGACDIKLIGKTDSISIKSEGASDIDTQNLISQNTKITMSGAGSAKIYASDKLNVQIHGAADIIYYGNPKSIKKNYFFAGSLEAGK